VEEEEEEERLRREVVEEEDVQPEYTFEGEEFALVNFNLIFCSIR
jgi:hypothetical protein